MKKILVTGGAGFIGSCLAEKLIEDKNNFVVIVDNLLTGDLSKLPQNGDNWKFIKCDVNDYQDISPVMLSYQFDFVFHYRSRADHQQPLYSPSRAYLRNGAAVECCAYVRYQDGAAEAGREVGAAGAGRAGAAA